MADPISIKTMLLRSVEQYANRTVFRYKVKGTWKEISYEDFYRRVRQVSQILAQHDIQPGNRVALFRENSPQWAEIYFGIVSTGAIAVPIDAKLKPKEVGHILKDAGATVLFTEDAKYPTIREVLYDIPGLDTVYVQGGKDADQTAGKAYLDYESAMEEVLEASQAEDAFFTKHDPQPGDTASFIYTSGTTGRPKGAMLSHWNFMSNATGVIEASPFYPEDNYLLVLPLHHSFAFTGNLMLPILTGASISCVESLRTIGENVREVSPTILIAVPLLLDKMYGRIMGNLKKNKLGHTLFRLGIRKPVVKKIREGLGGKIRLSVTGAAPCDSDLIRGFAQLGVEVVEGYGLTETAPVLCVVRPGEPAPGTVGPPLPGVEIKIRNPNEEGIGEITARGPNIMQGYYNNPEATAEVMDGDWFLTGDLGRLDKMNRLTITGRKKSLIVNREGKNIYPEEVELCLNTSEWVLESLVLGYQEASDKVGERVGVIIVPDQDRIDKEKRTTGVAMSEEDIEKKIKAEIKEVSSGLSDYKRPRQIQIRLEEFEKTSTQKVKRYLYAMNQLSVDDTMK